MTELTAKEKRVVRLVTRGLKNAEIGRALGIKSEHVVKNILRDVYEKTGLSNRVELAMWWIKNHEN